MLSLNSENLSIEKIVLRSIGVMSTWSGRIGRVDRCERQIKLMPWRRNLTMLLIALFGVWQTASAETSNRQALTTSTLRVCADPSNMPYSNKQEQGFENKIIDLVAEKLGLDVHYTWFPQTIGFVRNTLRLRDCDLISGITTTSELVQNTNPYYRSVYVMIYRRDSGLTAKTVSDPQLQGKKIGIVAGTPPATLVMQAGLMTGAKPYQLTVDTRHYTPSKDAVNDLIKGDIDAALLWGPLGAWHAKQSGEDLVVVPLLDENPNVRLDFRVSMAVRYQETDWKRNINDALKAIQPEIDSILGEFGIPLLDDAGNYIVPEQ